MNLMDLSYPEDVLSQNDYQNDLIDGHFVVCLGCSLAISV